jgi:hypothetical protein
VINVFVSIQDKLAVVDNFVKVRENGLRLRRVVPGIRVTLIKILPNKTIMSSQPADKTNASSFVHSPSVHLQARGRMVSTRKSPTPRASQCRA